MVSSFQFHERIVAALKENPDLRFDKGKLPDMHRVSIDDVVGYNGTSLDVLNLFWPIWLNLKYII